MTRIGLGGGFVLAATGFAGLVQADTLGTWLRAMETKPTDNVQHSWGPLEKGGWKNLPQNIVQAGSTVDHPLCLQEAQNGGPRWLGTGVPSTSSSGAVFPRCATYVTKSAKAGTFFTFDPNKPMPVWVEWNASKPEPRGAVTVATQDPTGRRLFACRGTGNAGMLGYVGDDAKCYLTGFDASWSVLNSAATNYQILVKSSAASDIEPRFGWVEAAPGYMPFGPMATIEEPTGPGPNGIVEVRSTPKLHTVCRVREGSDWWPGYLRTTDAKCVYFTWYGQTQKKESATYEVHRNGSYPLLDPYRFNNSGGKATYACTAFKNGQGPIVGFTNNPGQCTDGSRTDGNKIKLLALPNADHGRG